MSDKLFGRKAAVIVDGSRIEDLRITFSIEKKDTREANKATITITNLSPDSRARFDPKGLSVAVEAGYVGRTGAVFVGTSYRTTHKRNGADFVTTIEASDGGKEIGSSTGAWTFGKGALVASVILDIVSALGLPLSTGSRINPARPTFRNGWAFVGNAADALDAATKASGLSWSVQDGQVQILDAVDGDGSSAVLLSASTGMIGSPERVDVKEDPNAAAPTAKAKAATEKKKKRVAVQCFIQPLIRPGRIINVQSVDAPALSGLYVVNEQKIDGDTHGQPWTMSLEMSRTTVAF